jgi:hypothetical protein
MREFPHHGTWGGAGKHPEQDWKRPCLRVPCVTGDAGKPRLQDEDSDIDPVNRSRLPRLSDLAQLPVGGLTTW